MGEIMVDLTKIEGGVSPERSGGDTPPSGKKYDGQARPRHRRFSTAYKTKILNEIDACQVRGNIGIILRREGLYASQISQWRKAMKQNNLAKKKTLSGDWKNEKARLQRENFRLKAKLDQANKIIEIQKKMAEFVKGLTDERLDENPVE